jgi:protein-S-isoprenylcysteine O-methyltransferase Ste14
MYDSLMRLPLLGWVCFCTMAQLSGLIPDIINNPPIDFIYGVRLAMRLSTVAFLLLQAILIVFRSRPVKKAAGFEPRISALIGAFMPYGLLFFQRRELSMMFEMVSTILILIGSAGAIAALYQLGRSFSVMAETRQLVTKGPYRLVRHPLYLTEWIALIGLFIQFASIWTGLLLAVQFVFQLRRMHNEEMVLAAGFPEYSTYCRNTYRMIPGIY